MWDKPDSLIPNWNDLKSSDCFNVVCVDVVIISKSQHKPSGEPSQPFFLLFLKKDFYGRKKKFLASAKLSFVLVVKKIFTILRIKIADFSILIL
jgi:hypothetical protein